MNTEATLITISESTRAFIGSLDTCFSTENELENNLAVKLITALGGEENFLNQFAEVIVLGADYAIHDLALREEVAAFYKLNKNLLLAYADALCWNEGWETGAELILSHVQDYGLSEEEVNNFLQEDATAVSPSNDAFPVAAWLTWSSLEMLCNNYAEYIREQRRSK
ncbi:MAG: hypothetical protein J6N72_01625 [Psychrobacter sp.]|nr:hypothetical protein [Psychrobacter sp.]